MDVRTLSRYLKENNNDQGPDLASRGYLQAYSYLLRKDEQSHIGRNLEAHYHWVWEEEVALLTNAFQTAGGSLPILIKLAEGQLRLTSQNPKIIDNLGEPCRLVAKVLSDAAIILGESGQHRRQSIEAARQQLTQGYDFFGVMSAGLEKIIEKQVTYLTPDSAITLVLSLTNILYSTLLHDNSATRELLAAKRGEYPDLQTKYLPKIISLEWKFTILKRLITSAQMQLRVVGVTTMCGDLLSLHGAHKGNDPSQDPILLYFADFVIRNKIVEYLVGIASHPEIINESNNILGFLIVTNTFKQSQASTIWQTVTTSQDPRVVEAILRMLKRCLNLQKYEDLLFLCGKVKSLPIEAFTSTMRDFCEELFRTLVNKAACDGIQYVDAPPYELCVRLIRESSTTTPESPVGYPDIQNFAAGRFRDLLAHGPNGQIREEIYLDCISDVSDRTATAPGSICVINALLRQNMGTDLHTLTTEHGLTQLVIQELESTIAEDRHSSNPSIRNSPASQARRELLLTIIIYEPGTISPELGTKLWNLLVGSESRSVIDRNTWWQILNSAMKKSPSENVFITACFKDHLPTLPPDCFTIGALDFAKEAIASWLEASSQDSVDEDREFESLALEQLWRMILTAPPNTIDAQAIHILVEVYVESGLILSLPRAKARSIHLALVDRCLKQLAGAATKLKSFDQNSVSNGEEKGMVLVASENEFQEQEMIFARSLAVLREFLKTYQTKPQFATPKSRSPLSDASSALEGDPLEVRFQSFDGDKHTEVMSLTLGKRNTAAFLFASLQKATGFKNFKVFYGGKGFDPDEVDLCKSLEELNFNGLVLVQRRDEEDGPGHTSGSKTSLELEVTKHLDELWSYLGMHEKVAQEV
jgi:ubiquitin carboxyl-terminal hydrolase 34